MSTTTISTTATKQYATFVVGDSLYGVEVGRVQEVLRHATCTPVPLAAPSVAGLLSLRGEVVMAVDVRRRLGLGDEGRPADPMNVVIRLEDEEVVSLLVDRIGDVVSVGDELFEDPPETLTSEQLELVRGAYKLDKQLLHVLDVGSLVDV